MKEGLTPVIKCFLYESKDKKPKFSDLVKYIIDYFNLVDEQMFKEWTQKEFPNSFKFNE